MQPAGEWKVPAESQGQGRLPDFSAKGRERNRQGLAGEKAERQQDWEGQGSQVKQDETAQRVSREPRASKATGKVLASPRLQETRVGIY